MKSVIAVLDVNLKTVTASHKQKGHFHYLNDRSWEHFSKDGNKRGSQRLPFHFI